MAGLGDKKSRFGVPTGCLYVHDVPLNSTGFGGEQTWVLVPTSLLSSCVLIFVCVWGDLFCLFLSLACWNKQA